MRKSRYTDEQMVKILRETDRSPVAEVAKKHGVSEQTIYVWRKRFGVITADDTKRLRALEQENNRLKKLVAGELIEGMVRRLYVDGALMFGARSDLAAIVKAKVDWFAYFRSWQLSLLPGTLKVTPRGETRADAVFDITYDYVPKDAAAARAIGRARVTLGLEMAAGGWRIVSESSEALP